MNRKKYMTKNIHLDKSIALAYLNIIKLEKVYQYYKKQKMRKQMIQVSEIKKYYRVSIKDYIEKTYVM